MGLQMYGLDQIAQGLVLVCRSSANGNENAIAYRHQDVLGQACKMRTTVAYGLERFWGEHLRLGLDKPEGRYWKDVWDALAEDILKPAGILLPNDSAVIQSPPQHESKDAKERRETENSRQIHQMTDQLWTFASEDPANQRIALSVLTQLCDCLVWWTQRYKQD